MTTDNYHTAGDTKLHNLITNQATNYHYINNTFSKNTIDNDNNQSVTIQEYGYEKIIQKVQLYLATPGQLTNSFFG
jgi:hypothetical protein